MDSGLYAACAALMARTDALDTIANNLANSSTGGFRARHTTFGSVLAQSGHPLATQLNDATNSYGVLSGSRIDLTAGSLERTGNDLDVGIDGPGFLTVQTASGTAYTRSGALSLSQQGQIITSTGDPVLGTTGPITIPRGATVTISSDGTVSANGAVAGKLKMVEFAPDVDLKSLGNMYYTAPAKDAVAATKSEARQGMLEGSNVNPVAGVIELINAQRSAESMRHALTIMDTEMDKVAAQDLPRIS